MQRNELLLTDLAECVWDKQAILFEDKSIDISNKSLKPFGVQFLDRILMRKNDCVVLGTVFVANKKMLCMIHLDQSKISYETIENMIQSPPQIKYRPTDIFTEKASNFNTVSNKMTLIKKLGETLQKQKNKERTLEDKSLLENKTANENKKNIQSIKDYVKENNVKSCMMIDNRSSGIKTSERVLLCEDNFAAFEFLDVIYCASKDCYGIYIGVMQRTHELKIITAGGDALTVTEKYKENFQRTDNYFVPALLMRKLYFFIDEIVKLAEAKVLKENGVVTASEQKKFIQYMRASDFFSMFSTDRGPQQQNMFSNELERRIYSPK